MKEPDWNFWKLKPVVTLAEACALSFGIDPRDRKTICREIRDGMMGLPGKWILQNNDKRQNEFDKRLELLEDNVQAGILGQINRNGNGELRGLSEFAAWCMRANWEIPEQLKALAIDSPQIDSTKSAPATTEDSQRSAPASKGNQAGASAVQIAGEPPMRYGSNPATAYKPWIAYQAKKLKLPDDIKTTLAQRIVDLANERHYCNQQGNEFKRDSIIRLLTDVAPAVTGTRAKNGRKNAKK